MAQKSVLVCISTNLGISKLICDNLAYHGFEVAQLMINKGEIECFKYPSLFSRLLVKFKKGILKQKEAKKQLEMTLLKSDFEKRCKGKTFDYSLFFLAQNFSIDLVQYIGTKTKENGMVNYQWDGMARYPSIQEYIHLFDRFFVFDPNDVDERLYPATNFYFDYDLAKLPDEYDFYFLGGHSPSRCKIISDFANFAKKMNWNINIQIVCGKSIRKYQTYYPDNIKCLHEHEVKTFSENVMLSRKSKVLLDFVIGEHEGLSFRTFEALGYDKKLITTNKEIVKYDFYHPNNIFVLDDNFEDLPAFLEKPYYPIDPNIKQKYSFGNWINYVLNIEPHQPILLPNK